MLLSSLSFPFPLRFSLLLFSLSAARAPRYSLNEEAELGYFTGNAASASVLRLLLLPLRETRVSVPTVGDVDCRRADPERLSSLEIGFRRLDKSDDERLRL